MGGDEAGNNIAADKSGTVRAIKDQAGQPVGTGDVVVNIE
ncbi:MAG TPA: biotin/lipoyl-containing protein [Jiangellaceae bacterium]|nr:biotin/lipoyl-containing protein [Jiangellaceae bacterium]